MARLTFGLFMEISVDRLLPGFFAGIAQYDYAKSLDPGAFRLQLEYGRIEVDGIEPNQAADVELAINAIWQALSAEAIDERQSLSNFSDIGRLVVRRVEDAPQPSGTFGAGENPAVRCPVCDAPMVARSSSRSLSTFYGCSRYPKCGGTRPMSR